MNLNIKRRHILETALQKGKLLGVRNPFYRDYLKESILPLITEDFSRGDITTEIIVKKDFLAHAEVIAKQKGIVAGLEEAEFFYSKFGIKAYSDVNDRDFVNSGDVLMKLSGKVKTLLKTERRIIDMISRMSGIATMTYNLRKIINDKIGIAATRKSLVPYLDKKAVYIGGGLTHRLALWDGILVKDNHIAAQKNFSSPVSEFASSLASGKSFFADIEKISPCVEVEVRSSKEAIKIIDDFKAYKEIAPKSKLVLIIMFDNMLPSDITNLIGKMRAPPVSEFATSSLARGGEHFASSILFEASGNITENNIKEYANTGVDLVSVGMLTHSVKGFDVSQKLKC